MNSLSQINVTKVLKEYNNAEIINPPTQLKKIYVSPEQTEKTQINLAISYSYLVENELRHNKKGIQLFEIPPTEDNCQAYCGLGYEYNEDGGGDEWWNPDNSWTELSDVNDVSCHKGFEKVFQYGGHNNHLARQWGDGTILHKMGCTSYGATPVYRVVDSNHPYILKNYGSIEKIWIKPYPTEVPAPYLRWQSTHYHDYIGSSYDCIQPLTFKLEDLKREGNQKWQDYYNKMNASDATSEGSMSKFKGTLFNKQMPSIEETREPDSILKKVLSLVRIQI